MRKILKNKGGQGHIEMILSFVIFIGFVFALFIFFTPVRQDKVSYASLEKTQASLLYSAMITYDYVSIILNDTYAGLCISIDDIPDATGNILVKDLSGNVLDSRRTAGKIYAEAYSDRYYKIYFSSFFNSPQLSDSVLGGCVPFVKGTNYGEVVVSSGSDVFYENIQKINSDYMANYSKLKTGLGLLNDFEFIVYNFNYDVLMNDTLSVHKIKTFPVLSRDIPIRALTKTGEYRDLIMTVRVWK